MESNDQKKIENTQVNRVFCNHLIGKNGDIIYTNLLILTEDECNQLIYEDDSTQIIDNSVAILSDVEYEHLINDSISIKDGFFEHIFYQVFNKSN